MSNLIQLQNGSKSYATKKLFDRASFAVNAGEHIGVIGPNGAGKTTLFKVLVGEETLDVGEVARMRGLRLGYLAQHDRWAPGTIVEDYLSDLLTPIWELKALGRGLGLLEEHFERPIDALSGGYRMRVKLLHLLGQKPDLLLLDEPTNYLDLESVLVLERFLQSTEGAFLLISHDREFLRRTTDHIVEVEAGDIVKYNGNLDDYFEQKEMLRTQLEARAMSVAEKRQSVMDFVNRFGAKASKARQAQSRLKSLDRLEKVEVKALPNSARIRMPTPSPCGRVVLELKGVDLGYGDRRILQGVDFALERGHHLAVVGVNGAGKSTLLKALAGKLEAQKGEVKLGYQVSLGYYAQHVSEALDPKDTVLSAMGGERHPDVSSQDILNMAGSLLFSGDDVHKKISVLSGGEKSRVALGRILLKKSPFLVLDEPTNHLDFQTVEALTEALRTYEGTLVIVSHDRSFVASVATRILEVREGRTSLYPGTYDDYVWSIQRGGLSKRNEESAVAAPVKTQPIVAPKASEADREARKEAEKELRVLEKEIARLEKKIEELPASLLALNDALAKISPSDPTFAGRMRHFADIQTDLDRCEAQWLEKGTRRDELKAKIEG